MDNSNVYQVKIDNNTYDVISANTAFYAFVGDRIYSSFDQLMSKEDADRLADFISADKEAVLTMISADDSPVNFMAAFSTPDGKTATDIRLVLLDGILERERQVISQVNKKNSILDLYGDYYFDYDVANDNVRVYVADRFEQNILSASFAEFERKLSERADESNINEVNRLTDALKNGTARFEFNISGDILGIKETAYTLFKGSSCYEEGSYVYCTGYIHLWSERSSNSAENNKHAVERDYLTGVLTKAEITNLAINTIDVKKISDITLAIIDIDYFKKVNDEHGHMLGDVVLKSVASIIKNEVRDGGVVGRFGGDEFLVIFYNAYDMETMRERLRSIKNGVASSSVKSESGEDIAVTLSIGCAAYPKDADNYEDLFFLADFCLYRAKEKGRNRYIIYSKDKHGTMEEIKNTKMSVNTLNSRGDMSPAELVCAMQDRFYTGQDCPLDTLLDDIAVNMNIQRVMLYAGENCELVGMAGGSRLSKATINATKDYIKMPELVKMYDDTGVVAVDNARKFETTCPELYEKLIAQDIMSFVHIRFKDKNGTDAVLSFEYVKSIMNWNRSHFPYYRLLAKLLSEFGLGGSP